MISQRLLFFFSVYLITTNALSSEDIIGRAKEKSQLCHFPLEIIWKRELHHKVYSNPAFAHLQPESTTPEIVITGENFVQVIDSTGQTHPRFPYGLEDEIQIVTDSSLFRFGPRWVRRDCPLHFSRPHCFPSVLTYCRVSCFPFWLKLFFFSCN